MIVKNHSSSCKVSTKMLVPYQKAVYTYFQNSDTLKSKFGLDKLTVSKIFIHLFNENGSKLSTVHIPRNLCKVHRLYFCVNDIKSPQASQSLTEIIMYIRSAVNQSYSIVITYMSAV